MDNTQNVISFCTGYGGIELGLRRAGVDVRTVCNVEIEAFVQANLVAKIEEGRLDNSPVWTDLKTFPASDFRGIVDGICCGYPCQPFSSAGKRQGEEDPRHLWPYLRKHIQTIRPSWVFAENVFGHLSLGLSTVLSDLEEDGYRCTWGIFSAEEVGAPHQRKRVFILGYTTSLRPRRGRENCEGEQSEVLGERLESDGTGPHCELEPLSSRKPGTGGKILAEEAKKSWGTPQARDWKGAQGRAYKGGAKDLPAQTEGVPPHAGPPAPEKSSTSGKNHGSPKLNPNWVEQLMGLSTGWTDLGSWGTESCRKPQN